MRKNFFCFSLTFLNSPYDYWENIFTDHAKNHAEASKLGKDAARRILILTDSRSPIKYASSQS
jgi:hypothetical protein